MKHFLDSSYTCESLRLYRLKENRMVKEFAERRNVTSLSVLCLIAVAVKAVNLFRERIFLTKDLFLHRSCSKK